MEKSRTLQTLYFQVTDIWRRFCEAHSNLLDMTFEEYSVLLKSDIDALEDILAQKQVVIKEINALENLRAEIVKDLNEYLSENNQKTVDSISELIEVMSFYEKQNNNKHLFRYNSLLIDMIEKIQAQNKKNQVFLNRAINSLREIREEAMGVKNYSTYNKKGVSVKPAR